MGALRRLQKIGKVLFLKLVGKYIDICFTVILSMLCMINICIYLLVNKNVCEYPLTQ